MLDSCKHRATLLHIPCLTTRCCKPVQDAPRDDTENDRRGVQSHRPVGARSIAKDPEASVPEHCGHKTAVVHDIVTKGLADCWAASIGHEIQAENEGQKSRREGESPHGADRFDHEPLVAWVRLRQSELDASKDASCANYQDHGHTDEVPAAQVVRGGVAVGESTCPGAEPGKNGGEAGRRHGCLAEER